MAIGFGDEDVIFQADSGIRELSGRQEEYPVNSSGLPIIVDDGRNCYDYRDDDKAGPVSQEISTTENQNGYSVGLWIKPTAPITALVRRIVTANEISLAIGGDDSNAGNKWTLEFVGLVWRNSASVPTVDVWQLVGFTRSAGTTRIYMNGAEVYATNTTPRSPTTAPFFLRGQRDVGLIDDVRYWGNQVISSAYWSDWHAGGRGYLLPNAQNEIQHTGIPN